MHRFSSYAFGLAMLICGAGTGHAACAQIDLAGTWQVYGNVDAGTAVSGRCSLKFNSLGFLSSSKCAFRDNTLNANVVVGVVGSLHLRSAPNCTFEGTISISGGTHHNRSATFGAGLSRDKTILVATGSVVNDPNGVVSFTAMKP